MPLPPRDPGLQAERTALAWGRTALALLVNALLMLRAGIAGGMPAVTAIGVALLLVAASTVAFAMRRRRELTSACDPRPAPRAVVGGLATAVGLAAVGALVVAVAG